MVEIGSYAGQSMEAFAESGKVSAIACVDPWKAGYDASDPASSTDMEEVERLFDERAGKARDKGVCVFKHKGTLETFVGSAEFAALSGNVDFVYVDACHTYGAVKADLSACIDAIRPAVAFCGHDYVNGWPGVIKAVDEMVGRPDMKFPDGSWVRFVKKPEEATA